MFEIGGVEISASQIAIALAVPIVALMIGKMIKSPTRPFNDPYADTEFDENGAVRETEDSKQ
ncbi:MAG: hypothetical protein R3C51_11390 [Parvularculaceae bacterium]